LDFLSEDFWEDEGVEDLFCCSEAGFDDSGFAKTILLVEPIEPFLGTVRLDGLPYQNVDLKKFYPYGDVSFP
jgi:hypothetical protein